MSTTPLQSLIQQSAVPAVPVDSSLSLGAHFALRLVLVSSLALAGVFATAGTFAFWRGWLFLAVSVLPGAMMFVWIALRDPALAERRMQKQEPEKAQRVLIRSTRLLFVAAFLLPGLDLRFGWSASQGGRLPLWMSLLADALILISLASVGWVVRVNRFASRTIRVEEGHRVVVRGPYRVVRHPMYGASLVLWLAIPVALGSWVAVPFFALLIPFYVIRLLSEERLLRRELPGYTAYCRQTPFRLVPFIW